MSCADYVQQYRDRKGSRFLGYNQSKTYIDGVLTGINYERVKHHESPILANVGDRAARQLFLYDYCRHHPRLSFFWAVVHLAKVAAHH